MQHGKQQTPPAGQQEQLCTDGPIRAAEPQIRTRSLGRVAVHPIVPWRICHLSCGLWHLVTLGHMLAPWQIQK